MGCKLISVFHIHTYLPAGLNGMVLQDAVVETCAWNKMLRYVSMLMPDTRGLHVVDLTA